jgi:uncharacterized iron-regulated membrane protein
MSTLVTTTKGAIVSTDTAVAALVGANPGPAAHLALLGGIVVAALVIFGVVLWRRRREAGESERRSTLDDPPTGSD